MIRVDNDFVIEVDNYGFTARRDTHKTRFSKSENKEVPVYTLVGHYGSIASAVSGIVDYKIQTKLMDGVHELKDVVRLIKEEMRYFNELLAKAMEG